MYPARYNKVEKKSLTCIVDGQALLKVAYHGASNLFNSKGQHIGGLFQFFSILRKIVKENQVNEIIVFWDGKLSGKLRHNIYPDYKQQESRKKSYNPGEHIKDENLEFQKLRIKQYLEELSIKQFEDEIVEADDCIGYFILNKNENQNILIATGDRDLCQFINDDVSVYLLDKKRVFDINNYDQYFQYNIRNLKLIKIIAGDPSDNIKGIKGIGEETLLELFPELDQKECTLSEILNHARQLSIDKKGKSKRIENILNRTTVGIQGDMIYEINEKLINLSAPLLTEECLLNLNTFIESTIDPEGREIKNLLNMMMEDEFLKEIPGNSEGFVEYLRPFLRLIQKQN
jgi:5'-3' exonuclease